MGEFSNIGWTDHTKNFWIGCTPVSEACRRCYAKNWDERPAEDGKFLFTEQGWGMGKPRHLCAVSTWKEPFKWNRRIQRTRQAELVFPNSLADIGDQEVDELWRLGALCVIALTPYVTWQMLTKRIEDMYRFLMDPDLADKLVKRGLPWLLERGVLPPSTDFDKTAAQIRGAFPLRNVWLGTSVETERRAAERIPPLQELRRKGVVSIAFLSVEPLLENPRLDRENRLQSIDWVIVGGEHAEDYTPLSDEDLRAVRDAVKGSQKALYFKQRAGRVRSAIEALGCLIDGEAFKEYPVTETTDRHGPIQLAA